MGNRLDCELCGKIIPKEDTVEGKSGIMSKETLESKFWLKLSEGDKNVEVKEICRECHSQIKSRVAKLGLTKGDK